MRIETTALILLAGGTSSRFGQTNKLMTDFKGKSLIQHSIDEFSALPFGLHIGVIAAASPDLEAMFVQNNFSTVLNQNPKAGQGHSIALGAQFALDKGYSSVCICLADMPLVSAEHVLSLFCNNSAAETVFSQAGDLLFPPALFRDQALQALTHLTGDKGAKSLADQNTARVKMPEWMAADIDTLADLKRLEKFSR